MPRNRTVLLAGWLAIAGTAGVALGDGPVLTLSDAPPLSTLVRFDERDYRIDYDATVSLEPLSTATVRKIGYGEVSTVNITTTASGTYSTDGLISPHVLYPGLTVTALPEDRRDNTVAVFVDLGRGFSRGLVNVFASADGSFAYADNGRSGVACHMVGSFTHCLGH